MDFENMRIKDVRSVVRYSPNMKKWSAENRKYHFVGIMLDGSAHHDFGYKDFVLSRNCIYFFNRRDDYRVQVYDPGESFSVHFTTYEEIDTDSFCIQIESPDEIIGLLKRAESLMGASGESELSLLATLYKLCAAVSRVRRKVYFPRDARMRDAKEYIDLNFRAPDCLSGAVAQSGLSARRFCDLFKGNFDVTPNRYVTLRKIDYAKAMLETTDLSVAEIAARCGFSDVYYFSRCFRQFCGVSPARWRSEARCNSQGGINKL